MNISLMSTLLASLLLSTSVFASNSVYCPPTITYDNNQKSSVQYPFYVFFETPTHLPQPYIVYKFYHADNSTIGECDYSDNPHGYGTEIKIHSWDGLNYDLYNKNEPYGNKWKVTTTNISITCDSLDPKECPWRARPTGAAL